MKRAANLERCSAEERKRIHATQVDRFLIDEGDLCPYCVDLDCGGRGIKSDCMLWPNDKE